MGIDTYVYYLLATCLYLNFFRPPSRYSNHFGRTDGICLDVVAAGISDRKLRNKSILLSRLPFFLHRLEREALVIIFTSRVSEARGNHDYSSHSCRYNNIIITIDFYYYYYYHHYFVTVSLLFSFSFRLIITVDVAVVIVVVSLPFPLLCA